MANIGLPLTSWREESVGSGRGFPWVKILDTVDYHRLLTPDIMAWGECRKWEGFPLGEDSRHS